MGFVAAAAPSAEQPKQKKQKTTATTGAAVDGAEVKDRRSDRLGNAQANMRAYFESHEDEVPRGVFKSFLENCEGILLVPQWICTKFLKVPSIGRRVIGFNLQDENLGIWSLTIAGEAKELLVGPRSIANCKTVIPYDYVFIERGGNALGIECALYVDSPKPQLKPQAQEALSPPSRMPALVLPAAQPQPPQAPQAQPQPQVPQPQPQPQLQTQAAALKMEDVLEAYRQQLAQNQFLQASLQNLTALVGQIAQQQLVQKPTTPARKPRAKRTVHWQQEEPTEAVVATADSPKGSSSTPAAAEEIEEVDLE
jgi:hypothetical protein